MKYFLLLIFTLNFSNISFAQNETQEFKATHDGWLVDVEEAYIQSKKTGKPILANFTGSDWCGWCKKLSKSVFDEAEFVKWAGENVVLLELDFPRRKQIPDSYKTQNENLRRAFGVGGYPTVWLFDLEKDSKTNQFNISALGKTGYTPTASQFIADISKMMEQRASGE